MQLQSIRGVGPRRGVIAAAITTLCAALPLWAYSQATQLPMDAADAGAAGRQRVSLYTVVNLGPESSMAVLNERGQAAFTTSNYFGLRSYFFDGERARDIGTLGGHYGWIRALNNHGVVVGDSETGELRSRLLGFAWTAGGGMRALPGDAPAGAYDVNDRNEIAGGMHAPGISSRAVRWNPDGGITLLGPLPRSLSEARAINHRGYSTGMAELANGDLTATLWDPAGNQSVLGSLGTGLAFGMFINERQQVAGDVDGVAANTSRGFFWSRDSGMVPIDVGGVVSMMGLNDRGEAIGTAVLAARTESFHWSLGRGLVYLPLGSAAGSHVHDIDEHGEMVGVAYDRLAPGASMTAVRWPSFTAQPIDLNTRLHRAPAGLRLRAAVAINENGAILADSNAGLVLLRPGRRGTDAPVLGSIVGLPNPPGTVSLGQELALTINFVDNAAAQTHTASAVWTDGCASAAPTVTEANGVGQVRLRHRFCAPGYGAVKVVVTDSGGRSTELQRDVIVEAPEVAALSGEGALAGGAAALGRGYRHTPLRFALWAPLGEARAGGGAVGASAGAGAPVVLFSGPFQFRSGQVTRAVATAGRARVEGTGRLNGRAGYRFTLEAIDGDTGDTGKTGKTDDIGDIGATSRGASRDRLRLRVTHTDAATGAEEVDYDNGASTSMAVAERGVVVEGGLTLRP